MFEVLLGVYATCAPLWLAVSNVQQIWGRSNLYSKIAVTLIFINGHDSQADCACKGTYCNVQYIQRLFTSECFSSTCTASDLRTESWQQAYAAQSLHPAPLQVLAEAAQSPVERPADDSNLGNNRSAQQHIVRMEASCIVQCLHVYDRFMRVTSWKFLM